MSKTRNFQSYCRIKTAKPLFIYSLLSEIDTMVGQNEGGMADIVDKATRSRMMAGIKGRDTKPELLVRKALHRLGLRYRLHVKGLPGKPDLYFPAYNAVIFVHGCFWHHHDCHLFKMPGTKKDFWSSKLERNREVDSRSIDALLRENLRVCIIWECALKGKTRQPFDDVIQQCYKWIKSKNKFLEITGMI